jgi:hypothetical protein
MAFRPGHGTGCWKTGYWSRRGEKRQFRTRLWVAGQRTAVSGGDGGKTQVVRPGGSLADLLRVHLAAGGTVTSWARS